MVITKQKVGELAVIRYGLGNLERVGDLFRGVFCGVKYEQVGVAHKFTQLSKCPSLRFARTTLKRMRNEALT